MKDVHWLGDIRDQEFLTLINLYICNNIIETNLLKVVKSTSTTVMSTLIIITLIHYLQRCWATISRKDEEIFFHDHSQSHISFAYGLLKPYHSGDIKFRADSQFQISSGLFANEIESGLILNMGLLNSIMKR